MYCSSFSSLFVIATFRLNNWMQLCQGCEAPEELGLYTTVSYSSTVLPANSLLQLTPFKIQINRAFTTLTGVESFVIIKVKVCSQGCFQFFNRIVFLQVYLFIFCCSSEPLDHYLIHCRPLPSMLIFISCSLSILVSVEYFWSAI